MRRAALALLLCCSPLCAQTIPIVEPDPRLSTLPAHPSITLGRRAEALRGARPVQRTVIIVNSAHAAMSAIGGWRPGLLYPVLIDDGSERAAADIARFISAFEPEDIRLAFGEEMPAPTRDELAATLAKTWNTQDADALPDAFAGAKWTPPGVVVTDADHDSAIAALALASGRGQPIIWTTTPERGGDGILPDTHRDALLEAIGEGVRALPYTWDQIADEIDAVTLCLSTDARVQELGGKTTLALTDVVGRDGRGQRWAYAGWLRGNAAESLYDAMCALFIIDPGPFWVYDGYEQGFAAPYSCKDIGRVLNGAGLPLQVTLPPTNLPDAWRVRTRLPLKSGFVHVNSSGDPRRFQLGELAKRCYGSDVPTLTRPAIVHFIHSFSAQQPARGETIASRWLDEGAFVYLGSVDEPMLGAFLPAMGVIPRMLSGAAFGAAVRRDEIGPWRTQVMGDPLVTISKAVPPEPQSPRDFSALPTLEDRMREAAGARDLGGALRALIMLGRAEQARAILKAAITDTSPEAPPIDQTVALYGTLLAHASGDAELMVDMAKRLPSTHWEDARHSARLWRTLRHTLRDGNADESTLLLLINAKRPESAADDAQALLPSLTKLLPRDRVNGILDDLRATARFEPDKARIERMLGL